MNWTPTMGLSFNQNNIGRTSWTYELVHFISAEDKFVTVPYTKGVKDAMWIWYPKDQRPTTQKDWERVLGIKLETML